MTRFEITVLGANSAIPTAHRYPTSQLLNVNESFYLIDCGEGTQIQLRRNKLKFQRIEAIFISHLHGDHYFGLIGLLTTMHLLKRQKPLTIVAPAALKNILQLQLQTANTRLDYPIEFIDIVFESGCQIFMDSKIEVKILKLNHRIDCAGFVFTETRREASIKKSAINEYNLTIEEIKQIKNHQPIERNYQLLFDELIHPLPDPRTYVYITDTRPMPHLVDWFTKANLLYHETTFLKHETKRAKETYHSTTKQAAQIAKMAKVSQLMIGHYSTRYDELEILKKEVEEDFTPCILAKEGLVVSVN